MLSIDFFVKFATLDLQWFVELAMDNLLWVFLFIAVAFVYNNNKFSLKMFLVILISIISYIEFFDAVGIIFLVGGFLFVYYAVEVILLTFTETMPQLKGKIAFVLTVYFFVMLTLYNIGVF
ncbi:MAG: hypothetical protein ABH986_01210 [archaeon]